MSSVRIQRPHRLGAREALRRFAQVESSLRQDYGVSVVWEGPAGAFHGQGIAGQVHVAEEHIAIDLRLGIMLWPFTRRIQASLEEEVDRLLGG